jgi:hypothetical protein
MFAKVFEQILDSSIAEDWMVRHVFEDFLKLADRHGIVDMTIGAFSRRTGVPLDVVNRAIDKLCEVDPESRSADEGGRRLILLDAHRSWGWRIVNYTRYRDIRDEEGRREYFRNAKQKQRSKEKCPVPVRDGQGMSKTFEDSPALSTHAEVDTEANTPPNARATSPKIIELARSVGESLEALAPSFDDDPLATIPADAPPMQCAALVLERADVLAVPHLIRKFGDAIVLLGKVEKIGIPDSTRLMLQRVKEAQATGEHKWDLWLADSGWKGARGHPASPAKSSRCHRWVS